MKKNRNTEKTEFEEVFGDFNELEDMLVVSRDDFEEEILKYIPLSSAAASPECVLFAMYKSIEDKLRTNK